MKKLIVPPYKWKDKIRQRPGMYIGSLGLTGFKQMLEYVLDEILIDSSDNPVIEICFLPKNEIVIKCSNVDTTKFALRVGRLQTAEEEISTLGLGVFQSLSSDFSIAVGEQENGIEISYTLDKEMFKTFDLVYEHFTSFFRQFAFLNPGLRIASVDNTTNDLQRAVFYYSNGVFDQLDYFMSQLRYGESCLRINISAQVDEYSYQIGISYSTQTLDKSFIKTYAGNTETYQGGSLNDGILKGIISAIKTTAKEQGVKILINRKLASVRLIVIAAVKGEPFHYAGATRLKLAVPRIEKEAKQLVSERMISYFRSNPDVTKDILDRFKVKE